MSNLDRLIELFDASFVGSPIEMNEESIAAMSVSIGPLAEDEIVVLMSGAEGFEGTYEGPTALHDAWTDWLEAFSRISLEIETVERVGDNMLAYARQIGVTHHDDIELVQPSAAVFKFSGDRLARVEFYLDRAAAERSAGKS